MSVVVGVKDGTRVVLAADSRVMLGDLPRSSSSPKLRRVGAYVIGVCGDGSVLDAVFHRFDPPAAPSDVGGDEAAAFMVREFIPAYRDLLNEGRLLARDEGEGMMRAGSKDGSSLTVAWGPHLFGVSAEFALAHLDGPFLADGSGYQFAYGALGALVGPGRTAEEVSVTMVDLGRSAVELAETAVGAAIRFDPHCGGPVRVVMTEGA